MAALADGGFVVMWDSWNQVGAGRDVFASVARSADGDFVVVWRTALSAKDGAAGTLYLDEFESRRSSYIGP